MRSILVLSAILSLAATLTNALTVPAQLARDADADLSARASCSTTLTAPSSAGTVSFAGVNIAGFEFGCNKTGYCPLSSVTPPLASLGHADGLGQMQHFYNTDKFNVFRLPVGWQYLVNAVFGGDLYTSHVDDYDQLVQGCLDTGAHCLIDVHNYARWNGGIIGQGGPTNDQFASFWGALASKYADESRIIFGVMNEPHDLPSFSSWVTTVQAAVTAIRNAGASSQIILLPGTIYASAGAFVSSGSGPALLAVTNPDGSTTNLVFDVHQYLDSNASGTSTTCVTNNESSLNGLTQWLRCNKRQAFMSETGGGNTDSCVTYLNQELGYLGANSDVYLGYVGWAAGAFSTSYALNMVPTNSGGTWTDKEIVTKAMMLYTP